MTGCDLRVYNHEMIMITNPWPVVHLFTIPGEVVKHRSRILFPLVGS